MTKQPKKAGRACPECGSRDVELRAFSSSIKDVRPIGMLWSEMPPIPDGSALLKKKGKMTYRWRCNVCGHKFTAP